MDRFPECGKPIDLDLDADLSIDANNVPDGLSHLVPFVNKWSFDCLGDQDVFISHMKQFRGDEIKAINEAFNYEVRLQIRDWGISLPFGKHADAFSRDEMNHPFWSFLNVLKLLEATRDYENDSGV